MTIIRNGVEIELTAEELRSAYVEQEHEYDIEDVKYELEHMVADGELEAYFAKKFLENSERLSEIAREKRWNTDEYGMDLDHATQEAGKDALKSIMEKRPYEVEIREIYSKRIIVWAEDPDTAKDIADDLYLSGQLQDEDDIYRVPDEHEIRCNQESQEEELSYLSMYDEDGWLQ